MMGLRDLPRLCRLHPLFLLLQLQLRLRLLLSLLLLLLLPLPLLYLLTLQTLPLMLHHPVRCLKVEPLRPPPPGRVGLRAKPPLPQARMAARLHRRKYLR